MSLFKSVFNKASGKPSVSKTNMFLAPDGADAKVEEFRREVDAILTRKPNTEKKKPDNRISPKSKFHNRS